MGQDIITEAPKSPIFFWIDCIWKCYPQFFTRNYQFESGGGDKSFEHPVLSKFNHELHLFQQTKPCMFPIQVSILIHILVLVILLDHWLLIGITSYKETASYKKTKLLGIALLIGTALYENVLDLTMSAEIEWAMVYLVSIKWCFWMAGKLV